MSDIYSLSLFLNLNDSIPTWKVAKVPTSDLPVPITVAQAQSIARIFGDILGTTTTPTPFEVVREGSATMVSRVQERLQKAESEAQMIESLRQQLKELQ